MAGANQGTGSTGPQTINIESIQYGDKGYVMEVAKSLFANASLNEIDKNGNMVSVSDAKVKKIAKNCVKYAKFLYEEVKNVKL